MIARLKPLELAALERLRDETFAGHTLEAVGVYLIRDNLMRHGLLELGAKNRGPGAKRARPSAR